MPFEIASSSVPLDEHWNSGLDRFFKSLAIATDENGQEVARTFKNIEELETALGIMGFALGRREISTIIGNEEWEHRRIESKGQLRDDLVGGIMMVSRPTST